MYTILTSLPDVKRDSMKAEISIVLPTKEEEGAFLVIDRLKKMFGSRAEIIVVDKSGDTYRRKMAKTGVRLLKQTDKGVENGMIFGLKHATGGILASVDADGTHDLEGIRSAMKLIRAGRADLVMGNRMAGLTAGAMSGYLQFGNMALSALYNMIYGQNVHDVLTGMIVMDRKAYESVKNVRHFEMPIAFFQIEIAKKGFKVGEVPIKYTERKFGVSKLAKSKLVYGLKTGWQFILRAPILGS